MHNVTADVDTLLSLHMHHARMRVQIAGLALGLLYPRVHAVTKTVHESTDYTLISVTGDNILEGFNFLKYFSRDCE